MGGIRAECQQLINHLALDLETDNDALRFVKHTHTHTVHMFRVFLNAKHNHRCFKLELN